MRDSQRGMQSYLIFAVLRTLLSCSKVSLFYLKFAPSEGNPSKHRLTICHETFVQYSDIRRRAEYGFGEHGFKHQAQQAPSPSPSSGEKVERVPLSLLFVCKSELTEFVAELTKFARTLSLPSSKNLLSFSALQIYLKFLRIYIYIYKRAHSHIGCGLVCRRKF